jgi:hypothetical protein
VGSVEVEEADLVQRFRAEYSERDIDWESLGYEDAKVWAELAAFKDFETLFYRLSFVGRPGMLERPAIEVVPDVDGARLFHERWHEHRKWADRKYERDLNVNHFENAHSTYELAWFSYIRAVWERVQSAIVQDLSRTHERSQEALENLQIPEHLLTNDRAESAGSHAGFRRESLPNETSQ